MPTASEAPPVIDVEEQRVHGRALALLQDAGLAPMVGGACAMRTHAGLWRDTKDLDLFLRKDRVGEALELLARAGYRTELTDPVWIAKAFAGPYFIDLIFSSGNGIASVDEHWERRAARAKVLGGEALIVPAEEMIWQKAYIQERERFDGADIHHLLRCKGAQLDWRHLLGRFDGHWPILFGHLILGATRLSGPLDQLRPAAAFHGHAHRGNLRGATRGGVPVYNVALPVLRRLEKPVGYLVVDV